MEMVPIQFLSSANFRDGFVAEDRFNLTQKEVGYVQETAKRVAESLLRRLNSTWVNSRDGGSVAVPTVSLDSFDRMGIIPLHRGLALHALSVQLYAFSGGMLSHEALIKPLWLSLMLEGNGLRRMTADTAHFAEKLLALTGSISPETLGHLYISNPWMAYRLGLFSLVPNCLKDQSPANSDELSLRVRLAASSFSGDSIDEINQIAPLGTLLRTSLLSSAVAYAAKQNKDIPSAAVDELTEWMSARMQSDVTAIDAPLIAQVINAINLILLRESKIDSIEANMNTLMSSVTPRIESIGRRAHIEGNAYYQQSILAKVRNDRAQELALLLKAMNFDCHFSTLYYRAAQILHDQGDTRSDSFYELALALSPLDFPIANDYGVWLVDSNQSEKFESWSTLCQALYPEQFEESAEDTAV